MESTTKTLSLQLEIEPGARLAGSVTSKESGRSVDFAGSLGLVEVLERFRLDRSRNHPS